MTKMFTLLGDKPEVAAANAKTVMDLETDLAKASMTRVERRDPVATYHKLTLDEVQALMPDFAINKYLLAAGRQDPGSDQRGPAGVPQGPRAPGQDQLAG